MLRLATILNKIGDSEVVSKKLCVSIDYVEEWLKGIKYPNVDYIRRIAKLVNMSEGDIWRAIFNDAIK